jgi:asparagine N-glycosylation enzyme membrane subunit Stt3
VLLGAILFVAFWIRIQGVPNIPEGQFTGNDPYLYYWQAQIVSEQGRLPARDMHRWQPIGRDHGQSLNAYAYAIAYTHKAITVLFPNVSLYQVSLFFPVICFVLGLGVLCFFLHRNFGLLFSCIVGVLLATLPRVVERSAAGFSDRDSWCLMLGIFAIVTYLASLQTQSSGWRRLLTITSGFVVFLGGISWEGFGVFISVILVVELWKFLTSEEEERLHLYFLWVCIFVPTLYLASPAYRSGGGFTTHLFAFVLIPPLVLLGIRALRHVLITKSLLANKFRPHTRNLSLGLVLASFALALGYVWMQLDTFAATTVPLSQNALMRTVGELNTPDYRYWVFRYGSLFFLGSLGFMSASIHLWKNRGAVLAVFIFFFMLATFFHARLDTLLGVSGGNILFFTSLAGITLVLLFIAWRQRESAKMKLVYVAMIAWFLLWVALSRDAKRYDFFIGLPIAFFTADLIQRVVTYVTVNLKNAQFLSADFKERLPLRGVRVCIAVVMVAMLMYWTPAGEHAKRATFAATQMRQAKPGDSPVAKAFEWMKVELSGTAIVAAEWGFGSQLNVLGGVKTVIDQDHYVQHWIHLFNKHVRDATDARAALEFLKIHDATHVMLTQSQSPEVFQKSELSNAFVPVYPIDNFEAAAVKVWQIRYPLDIQPNPKYLATEP